MYVCIVYTALNQWLEVPRCCFADITPTGPKSCLVADIEFRHGDKFHPPDQVQEYEEAGGNMTTNPYCIECQCNVSELVVP